MYGRGLIDEKHQERIRDIEAILNKKEWTQMDARELIISVEDRVWVQKDFELKSAYLEFLEQVLGISPFPVDFRSNHSHVCEQINRWVSEKSFHQIDLGYSPSNLPEKTQLLPISTIYFKDKWRRQFESPEKGVFHLLSGDIIEANMISVDLWPSSYLETDIYQLIRIPYKHRPLFLCNVLPLVPGKTAFQTTLKEPQKQWRDLSIGYRDDFRVILTMPEFKITGKYRIIEELLKAQLITPTTYQLDFTEISEDPTFTLLEAAHLSTIDVNEFGTVAAAATYAFLGTGVPPQRVVNMRVDRPFLFAIIDDVTETLLFWGKVINPSLYSLRNGEKR